MKIIVTGGSGFLGSHVADELSNRGHDVTIFDKKKSKWIRPDQKMYLGDILNANDLENAIKGAEVFIVAARRPQRILLKSIIIFLVLIIPC